uniref:RxLR effector candidate protein n=2 Tax=Hyaloperonospora arabidopsidis (strain Emoy2) TaxID=559515 RepID=A0A090BHL3_HYAAE|nr:RxLR effector candidate protein [Hyaloperonospora arabidopsidis Emoy2]
MRHFFSSFAVVSALVTALSTSSTIAELSRPVQARRTLRTEGGTITTAEQGPNPTHGTSTLVETQSSIQEERRNGGLLGLFRRKMDFKTFTSYLQLLGIRMTTKFKKLAVKGLAGLSKRKIVLGGFLSKVKLVV